MSYTDSWQCFMFFLERTMKLCLSFTQISVTIYWYKPTYNFHTNCSPQLHYQNSQIQQAILDMKHVNNLPQKDSFYASDTKNLWTQ